jgi:streptogramin lyase
MPRRRRLRVPVVVLVAASLAVPITGLLLVSTALPAGAALNFYTDPGIAAPHGIAAGPDGALWFVNLNTNSIGRIDTAGAVTSFTDPSISAPVGIAAGSDGALWFTNAGNDSIGRITTAGAVTNFTDVSISNPGFITAGPDGALWFTNGATNSIGRITTGGAVTNYADVTISAPGGITAGPDGALWFANQLGNSIGRITTAGAVTAFTDPSIAHPNGVALGSDGALWFTNGGNNSIGRITTGGAVTNFPDSLSGQDQIVAGPDGALWYTNTYSNAIGRITTSGVMTSYTDPGVSGPNGIVAGHDGALWFTNPPNNSIGRITTPPVSCGSACVSVLATPGTPVESNPGPPTDTDPTKLIVTLPGQAGGTPVKMTLKSVDPGPGSPDRLLCPTATPCRGQIAVVAGNFSNYVDRAHPIRVQIVAKWQTKVPAGRILMAKDSGDPPIQLAACALKAGKYNTPCERPEIVKGSAATHDLTTTDTILFVGTDPRFARHVADGPDAPTAVKATAGKRSAKVTWSAPVVTNGRVVSYAVIPHLGSVAKAPVSFAGTARKGTITGLVSGKSYTFTVKAKTATGISPASKASSAVKVT